MSNPTAPNIPAPTPQPSSIVSLSIRSEIHRFESVHPSIYSIYELLDQVGQVGGGVGDDGGGAQQGLMLAQAIREHVVNIEDCFVNSQEWTLSRSVSELHVGLLGSQSSPKSTLVHRYLTNQYVQDNSPEGGRFKKEIILNNTPYLLLLRDEGGPPELQFSHWTDAIILVASSTQTTNTCFSYITRLANYRSLNDIPIVLVSVEEAEEGVTSTPPPDFIKELKKIPHSAHFHCNVRNGDNVDRIFTSACNMIISKRSMPPPAVPQQQYSTTPTLQRSNSTLTDQSKTPISTPTTSRKFRRRSNLFKSATQDLGSGRTIPIKQGYLLKKSNNSNSKITNKKWKKKYVTISEGKLEYFDHINQYMDNPGSGKPIDLKHVTVKLTRSSSGGSSSNNNNNNVHQTTLKTITDSLSTLSLKKHNPSSTTSYNLPHNSQDDSYGFQLISISKQWDFETNSKLERDQWVELIEEQIARTLRSIIADRVSSRRKDGEGVVGEEEVALLKSSNPHCADCGGVISRSGGYWASLNLCVVVCIGCSGVHRNLGSHLSKVRSFELDEMSALLLSPLRSIQSNTQANAIYEANLPSPSPKPTPNSSQEERSSYIRRKYEALEFLPKEPATVTIEMVEKCIAEKDFSALLLYVSLGRREGTTFWSDGSLLNLACSADFTAGGQVILWMTNDVIQQACSTPARQQPQQQYYPQPSSSAPQPCSTTAPSQQPIPTSTTEDQPGQSAKKPIFTKSTNYKGAQQPPARVLNNNNNHNSGGGVVKKIVI